MGGERCKQNAVTNVGVILPVEAFSRNASRHDGLQQECKECHNAYQRRQRAKKKKNQEKPIGDCLYLADVADLLFASTPVIMNKLRAGEFPFDGVDNNGRLYWRTETIRKFILKRIEERKSA